MVNESVRNRARNPSNSALSIASNGSHVALSQQLLSFLLAHAVDRCYRALAGRKWTMMLSQLASYRRRWDVAVSAADRRGAMQYAEFHINRLCWVNDRHKTGRPVSLYTCRSLYSRACDAEYTV